MPAKSTRVFAREAMQKYGYDPLEVLVKVAQDESSGMQLKMSIAETLLPYAYPKLNAVTIDADTKNSSEIEASALLMQKVLSTPELADAAARLSLASAESIVENDAASKLVM